ncbi:MAG: hypothetical protein HQL52_05235 [Magnetococcales bacterium]|nr:hypothetical protein [Magnetococcales bacterium]
MGEHITTWMGDRIVGWLTSEAQPSGMPLCNFQRLTAEVRPCDVILVEGRSRVSEVIKTITQSPWSHSVLYIGRLSQIDDLNLRRLLDQHYQGDSEEPLVVEAMMGEGTVVTPLSNYRTHHLRICRPKAISQWDALKVIEYAIHRIGTRYDVRQIIDLARFLLPYSILPRRFRSSLFSHQAGDTTRTVCSSMLAQAFMSVHFPILPVVQRNDAGELKLYRRNFRLFTPRDFDHSPYFEIIKYPLVGHEDLANYRNLPWDCEGLVCNAEGDCYLPGPGKSTKNAWVVSPKGALHTFLKKTRRLISWPFSLPSWGLGGPFHFASRLNVPGLPADDHEGKSREKRQQATVERGSS